MPDRAPSYHVEFLKTELERRKGKNPRYSMRAFASFLDIHPSALSRILNGIQEISLPTAQIVLQQLKMSDDEKRLFLASVAEEKRDRATLILAEASEIPAEEVQFGSDSILSIAPFYGFAIDLNKRILYFNECSASWLKTAPRDLIGRSILSVPLPAEFANRFDDVFEKAMNTKRPARIEIEHVNSDGPRNWEMSASPVRSKMKGEIYAVVLAIVDITDRKTASTQREALFESEKARRLEAESAALLSQILQEISADFVGVDSQSEIAQTVISKLIAKMEAAGGAIFQWSHDRRYLEPIQTVSPKTTLRTGRISIDHTLPTTRCARSSTPIWNAPLDNEKATTDIIIERGFEPGVKSVTAIPLIVHGHLKGVLELRFRSSVEFRLIEKQFLETVSNLVAQALDRIDHAHDIEQSCSLLDTILHDAPIGILYVDRNLRILRANDEFAKIAKRPINAFLNQLIRQTRLFDDFETALDCVLQDGKTRRDLKIKFFGRTLQASLYPVFAKTADLKAGQSGEISGVGVLVTDITDRLESEARRVKIQQILLMLDRSLNSTYDIRETIHRFFRLIIPSFAEICSIHVNGISELADLSALYPSGFERGDLYARTRAPGVWRLLEDVRTTGKGKHLTETDLEDSVICVPLPGTDSVFGTLTFLSAQTTRIFDDEDLAAALEMAAGLSIALRNAKRLEADRAVGNPN